AAMRACAAAFKETFPEGFSSFAHFCGRSRHLCVLRGQTKFNQNQTERKSMLGVGEKFPSYSLTATVGIESDPKKAFQTMTDLDFSGKWKVYFFWPKAFTLLCPTEVIAFGKLDKQFKERDAQILGGSIDSEWVHHAW